MSKGEHSAAPERTVLVVIVTYKTADLVKNLLASLAGERAAEAARNIALRVVVIDSASGDSEMIQGTVADAGQSTGMAGDQEGTKRLPGYWFESRRGYFTKNHGVPYAMMAVLYFFLLTQLARQRRC